MGRARRSVAAHRELTDHDDPPQALPRPPKPGQVEAYASWRAAWRALDRDEADRAEAEMSDGQLRVRVRAYQREEAWAPDYVAPDLSGTLQAAQRHRTDAQLRAAEADTETDQTRRAQLHREATESAALADVLDRQAAQLDKADDTRARWYAHTANTRAAEQRARHELAARSIDPDTDDRDTTAEQWLEAHRAEQAVEDQHREITDEHDLTDLAEARDTDHRAAEPRASADAADTDIIDIREHTEREAKPEPRTEHDWTRVPTADQTADSISRAQRALAELEARQAEERRHQAEEDRERQIARWRADDHATQCAAPTNATSATPYNQQRLSRPPPGHVQRRPARPIPSPLQRRHHPARPLPLKRGRRRRRQILRHRSSPASPHAAAASTAQPASPTGQSPTPTPADRPATHTSAPRRPGSHRSACRLTAQTLGERPQRAELGPGHPQVLTRNLRDGLGGHLHAIQNETDHRQRAVVHCCGAGPQSPQPSAAATAAATATDPLATGCAAAVRSNPVRLDQLPAGAPAAIVRAAISMRSRSPLVYRVNGVRASSVSKSRR